MWRIIKQIVLGLLLGVFLLVVFVFGYFYFNQDKIVKLLIDEVNRNVNAQVDVRDVSMSFWERFPQVSIKFQNVTIHNAKGYSQQTDQKLLVTEHIYFDLDLKTLISESPEIRRLSIGPGELNLLVDKYKTPNYLIINESEGGDGKLEVGNIEIDGLIFNYHDFSSNSKTSFKILSADVSAKFGPNMNQFDVNFSLQNLSFIPLEYRFFDHYGFVGQVNTTQENQINWNGILSLNELEIENKGSYSIKNQVLAVESSQFSLNENHIKKVFSLLDLPMKTDNASLIIEKLLFERKPKGIYLNTTYSFDCNLDINKMFNSINISNKGSVVWDNKKIQLNVDQFNAKYANSNVGFNGDIKSGQNIEGKLNLHLELDDFKEFLSQYDIEKADGIVDGVFQIETTDKLNANSLHLLKGEAGLTNISLNLTDNHLNIEDVQSLLYFNDDEIIIEELKGIINKNDVEFSGTTKGLQHYLFSDGMLNITGDVFSNEFYLSDFLYASPESQSGTIKLGKKLNMELDVIVKEIRNNNFKGDNLSLKIDKKGHKLNLKNFDINTSDGHLSGNGVLLEQENGEWYTTVFANIDQIEIGEFFAEMNEFGQNYIVSDNLKGKLNAQINSDFVFDPQFKVKSNSIYLDADVEIIDGELINYKTVEALSDFISIDELNHIKFNTLRNHITINDNKIVIPKMQIQSSAIDLGLVGVHSFNDSIDYQISVGLTDVLFGKIPRRIRKESNRRKNKKLTLFVDISGNINDPKISLSKISREKVIESEENPVAKKKFEIEFEDN